jgi:signal transduction histidine kinase
MERRPDPRLRVLVCDDAHETSSLVRSILEPGMEVRAVATGEAALAQAPTFLPDLIIADLALPGLSGSELCRRVREMPALAEVPFILVTSRSDSDSRALGLEAGADDYLSKPLRERELRARVASLMRLRGAMQALEARSRELEASNAALREAQSALVRSGKLASVGTMAAGLAHEITNPLSYMKASAQALFEELDRMVPPAVSPAALAGQLGEVRHLAEEILEGSRRLERIAASLRDIASPTAPAEELVDPAEALESAFVLARARSTIMTRLELDVEAGPPIESVGRLLTQGLLPVVENAIQASGQGGVVRVRIRQLPGGIELYIRDSGPGIAPEVLPRIFDPFFSTRPQGQAMGLGLSIAYGIVHGLGGDIHVESKAGAGATFRVRLPRRSASRVGAPPGS